MENKYLFKIFTFYTITYFLLSASVTLCRAQTTQNNTSNSTKNSAETQGTATMGVARYVQTKIKNIKDGMVVSNSERGAIPSNTAYDPQVLGVVAQDAAIVINSTTGNGINIPIISVGNVYLLVSTQQGAIKKGDLLTTSTIPGIAVKAVKSGYVLGTALEDYTASNPKSVEKIVADLDLHYFNSKPSFLGSLSDILKFALLSTKDSPAPIFKSIVAAIVIIGSFVLGFMTFGRAAAKGVEALGRNPAASRIIHLGIIFNVIIVCVIILAGLFVAFLILRL